MHILVVDDSTGMRRILTATLGRLGFSDVTEAENAESALAHLHQRAVDLAIIDWNLPGLSGLDLAEAIRSEPATRDLPLLMVTGNGAAADVARALRSGFGGYIIKPFTEDTFAQQLGTLVRIEVPRRSGPAVPTNWNDWLTSGAWKGADFKPIPAPPRSFREVFALAGDTEVDAGRLIRLISRDPVFAIRILRLANVAAFAAAGEVTSIDIAVVRLGTRAVRNALLAACLSTWAQTVDLYGRRGVEEIQHSVGTACLSRRIAERLRLPLDDAFVHGLLHDVGKLCLLKMRSDFRRLGGRLPSNEEFDETVGTSHPEVGAVALQVWGLPEPLRLSARWHHDPMAAPAHQQAVAVTYLANRLSHRYGFGCPPDEDRESLLADPAISALGLEENWLDQFDEEALTISMTAQHLVS
jgi:two-component system chemotaxis response regulator CheY